MEKKMRYFIKDNFISMNLFDAITKGLSYFVFCIIMAVIICIVAADLSEYGLDKLGFFTEEMMPYWYVLGAFSIVLFIVTLIVYKYKTMWSVILNRAITNVYSTLVMLYISCFVDFKLGVIDIIEIAIKILVFVLSAVLWYHYLFREKIPNLEKMNHGGTRHHYSALLTAGLILLIKPLATAIIGGVNMFYTFDINWLFTGVLYLCAVGDSINCVELCTKAYFAKKYKL